MDPFRLYRELTPLRHIKRFQQHATVVPISVAEHSFYVALIAGAFTSQLQRVGVEIDRALVIEGALWHDACEAFMGDVPHPVTRQFPELGAAWDLVERCLEGHLSKIFESSFPLIVPGTLSANLIKFADWAELLLYVYEEQLSGNRAVDKPAHTITGLLEGVLWDVFHMQYPGLISKWYRQQLGNLKQALGRHDSHVRMCFLENLGGLTDV